MSIRSIDLSLQRMICTRLLKASGYPPLGKPCNQLQPVVGDHNAECYEYIILRRKPIKENVSWFSFVVILFVMKTALFM